MRYRFSIFSTYGVTVIKYFSYIKPYLPFAESVPDAIGGFAQQIPDTAMPVYFSALAEQQLTQHQSTYSHLRRFITQVLNQDPRPAYRKGEVSRDYASLLLEFNARWRVMDMLTEVLSLEPAPR